MIFFPRHIQHCGPRGPRLAGGLPLGELPHRDQRLPRLQRHLRTRLPRMRGLCWVHQCCTYAWRVYEQEPSKLFSSLHLLFTGLSVSAYISLTSIILVDLLGLDALTSAFGLLVSFRGVASIVGPPLAGSGSFLRWFLLPRQFLLIFKGFVYEVTDDLNASFYMAGGFFVAAGIISQIAYFMQRFAKKKK